MRKMMLALALFALIGCGGGQDTSEESGMMEEPGMAEEPGMMADTMMADTTEMMPDSM